MLRAWFSSCASCLWPQADQESKRPQARQDIGVEREMQICHSQPHLVPPMKLVFYDDLPSPGGMTQSRSSLSLLPWVQETKTMANRASQRASTLLARRKIQSRPIIGAPTDFRHVDSPGHHQSSFRPLELSIYSPENRLSDLPEFTRFDLNTPSVPKALVSPFNSAGHRRTESGPFQLARKPVGSAPSRRSSFGTIESQLQQAQTPAWQSLDANPLSPLIPHFSALNTTDPFSQQYDRSVSGIQTPIDSASGSPVQNNHPASLPETPSSPKPPAVSTDRNSLGHQRRTTKRQPNQTPLLSSSSSPNTASSPHHQSFKSSSAFHTHSRVRTTSNSTVSSRTPSLSSAITAATTIIPSDKDIEAFTTLPMIPASAKNSIVFEEPQVHDKQEIISGGYEYDHRFPLSPVGVAF